MDLYLMEGEKSQKIQIECLSFNRFLSTGKALQFKIVGGT